MQLVAQTQTGARSSDFMMSMMQLPERHHCAGTLANSRLQVAK
eukprot:CAMPEP_0178463220 /NCGR_PEP_ID=MMETSP0689_2-20121128/50223_1 /TAXON_ID=160604 /ORGANISM="Amphidinium massartii, Strain CS-259" /LENGTH=42 /DNA_ID= /DNA_START= /DNA_END= /DNA_ORIENTATION=